MLEPRDTPLNHIRSAVSAMTGAGDNDPDMAALARVLSDAVWPLRSMLREQAGEVTVSFARGRYLLKAETPGCAYVREIE
jgi:hypothetical protein